ncbi:hypothetical protein [Vreelandella neptunia]|uniref:Uncharacterized protein n=1 Tax=Vreelandella neptunia TaxID=115551 RepID=A0ABZ0YQR1_9GAMM|nr:hypothetical protein [Halomonas neptunia]MDN3558612.1 hypothetical protein [Halomonas neptunia]WQH13582.1 hypothetical protein SR894_03340 [Halomonas neptunia]
MIINEYFLYYRRSIDVDSINCELGPFDVFVSAYNSSDRVRTVFEDVRASRKIWLMHPEYKYAPIEYPDNGEYVAPEERNEKSQVEELIQALEGTDFNNICIDITGFMRHVLIFLIAKLKFIGVKKLKVVYSEPKFYRSQEDTQFSTVTSGTVGPVMGMAQGSDSEGDDYLLLGVGYDHELIGEVVNNKDSAKVYPIFSFPSLSPDMYQQSALRASKSGDVALEKIWQVNKRFFPANDPFAIASILSDVVKEVTYKDPKANIYISPLSTKVQALGFSFFWLKESKKYSSSLTIILPQCITYSRETSSGINRLWEYQIEF